VYTDTTQKVGDCYARANSIVIRHTESRVQIRLGQEYEQDRDDVDNLVVVYAECISPGLRRLKIIREDRASWIGGPTWSVICLALKIDNKYRRFL